MAVTGTINVRELIKAAYRKSGIVGLEETPTGAETEAAREELEWMLKSWQQDSIQLFLTTSYTVTLSTDGVYSLALIRPLEIQSARFKRNGIETPMQRMTRNEYDTLPDKTTTGTPTSYYYDKQREAAQLYVWPGLATASGETVEITYTKEFDDITDVDSVLQLPGEMREAAVYNLADRLCDTFDVQKPIVTQRAQMLYEKLLAFDREGSIFFGEEPPWSRY
jgi:hypothetical protein